MKKKERKKGVHALSNLCKKNLKKGPNLISWGKYLNRARKTLKPQG